MKCDDYDFIEIACMYQYPVALTLRSGLIVNGIAIDTKRNEQRIECIKINTSNGDRLVILDDISKMQAGVANPHFNTLTFL